MRIGIVSDTHGHVGNAARAADALREQRIERVLHCGDIGSVEVVLQFARWPADYVFGNCEHDEQELADAIQAADGTCHGLFGTIELEGRRIALLHGHEPHRLREAIASGDYDLVCYGHTHVPEHHYVGETLVLNPGALFRSNPHTFAVVELPSRTVTSVELT